MREGFKEIVSGWMLISGLDDLTERIDQAGKWTEINGPLEPDEEATIKMMLEAQIMRSCPHAVTIMGYGLAGGGIGAYEFCEVCGTIVNKWQDET